MEIFRKNLLPGEKITGEIFEVTYQQKRYSCVVTDKRVLLQADIYNDEEHEIIDIQHEFIMNISLEKGWYIDLIYLIPISFSLAFVCLFSSLITYFPLSFTPANIDLLRFLLYPGIIFVVIGIGAVFFYFKYVKFSKKRFFGYYRFQHRGDKRDVSTGSEYEVKEADPTSTER